MGDERLKPGLTGSGMPASVVLEKRKRERRVRERRRHGAGVFPAPVVASTVIGDMTLSHVSLTVSGPRASRRLTASQYRALMSLLIRPGGRAAAEELARDALDMQGFGDPTALRKCIQRLNALLRTVGDAAYIQWRGHVVSLVIR